MRNSKEIQHDIDHVYDYGTPDTDAGLDCFNSGMNDLQIELEEAVEREK